jgi:hypothetical protein
MGMATTKWSIGKTAKPCAAFPHVWAAIHGCTGSGKAWRYTVGHFGRRTVEHACEVCKAARERLDALRGLTAELERLQAAAGVEDYRLAEVRVEKGRPVLTGRLDAYNAREALLDALTAWIDGYGTIARCVELIIAINADCRAEVARVCTTAQRAELAAAYRAGKRCAA